MILILHNEPGAAPGSTLCPESDAEVLEQVAAVAAALRARGESVVSAGVSHVRELPGVLASSVATTVVNLVEALGRAHDMAPYVPAICAAFGKACTGCGSACLALTLDKWRTRAVLEAAGVPVAAGICVRPADLSDASGQPDTSDAAVLARLPAGPLIVKPLSTDGSEGIDAQQSVFDNASPAVLERVRVVHAQFEQPALVEQFYGTREYQAALLERDGTVLVLAIAEIDFSGLAPGRRPLLDYAAKWHYSSDAYVRTPRVLPARIGARCAAQLADVARAAWHATGCSDYARVDFRAVGEKAPVVLEVNANPDIGPDSGYAAALAHAGVSYEEFVATLIRNAGARAA
jgi:D-alanine-D-alanine ligase